MSAFAPDAADELLAFHDHTRRMCRWAECAARAVCRLRPDWETVQRGAVELGTLRRHLRDNRRLLDLFTLPHREAVVWRGVGWPSWHGMVYESLIHDGRHHKLYVALSASPDHPRGLSFFPEHVEWRNPSLHLPTADAERTSVVRSVIWDKIKSHTQTDLSDDLWARSAERIPFYTDYREVHRFQRAQPTIGGWASLCGFDSCVLVPHLQNEYRAVLREMGNSKRPPVVPTIWYHGGRGYSIDGVTPYAVTLEESELLQVFMKTRTAMETCELERLAGVTNVSQLAKRLVSKYGGVFKPAARLPGDDRGAGFFFRVCSAVEL